MIIRSQCSAEWLASNGDPVRIDAHVAVSGTTKGKGKKKPDEEDGAVEGIVYKVRANLLVPPNSLNLTGLSREGHRSDRRGQGGGSA
jgi:hypothetical protein